MTTVQARPRALFNNTISLTEFVSYSGALALIGASIALNVIAALDRGVSVPQLVLADGKDHPEDPTAKQHGVLLPEIGHPPAVHAMLRGPLMAKRGSRVGRPCHRSDRDLAHRGAK